MIRNLLSVRKKRADGFTLIEILATIALFLISTVFLLQAFNLGFISIGDLENTNLALYLASKKVEEIRDQTYSNISNQSLTDIPGFTGYKSKVDVTFPQSNKEIKEVVVTIDYGGKDGRKNAQLKTLIVNN